MRKGAKIGDVFQLSLPNGRYAYGRNLRDAAVAFYAATSEGANEPPIGSRDYQFVVGVDEDAMPSEQCPIVGHDPSRGEDDEWPPPQIVRDALTDEVSLYVRGEIRDDLPVRDEDSSLEEVAAWGYEHVIERLMRNEA